MGAGYRLAELRNDRKMSQRDLARLLNVSQAYVGQWESEKRKIPTEKVVEIANIFDVSTDYVLGVKDSKSRNLDLRQAIKDSVMTYGGKEISEHNLKVLEGIVSSLLGDDIDGDE